MPQLLARASLQGLALGKGLRAEVAIITARNDVVGSVPRQRRIIRRPPSHPRHALGCIWECDLPNGSLHEPDGPEAYGQKEYRDGHQAITLLQQTLACQQLNRLTLGRDGTAIAMPQRDRGCREYRDLQASDDSVGCATEGRPAEKPRALAERAM